MAASYDAPVAYDEGYAYDHAVRAGAGDRVAPVDRTRGTAINRGGVGRGDRGA